MRKMEQVTLTHSHDSCVKNDNLYSHPMIQADCVSGLLHLPECFSARSCLEGLDQSAKASSKWTEDKGLLGLTKPCWQKVTIG